MSAACCRFTRFDYASVGGARGRLGSPSVCRSGDCWVLSTPEMGVDCAYNCSAAEDIATEPLTNRQSAQVSSWCARGHFVAVSDSMWAWTPACAAAAADVACTTLATPGMTACANAATRIQIRRTPLTRLTT